MTERFVEFSGVLLKPLDQQGDRDGTFIDPAGVKFDPETEHPIWNNFSYKVPDDWLGTGKVSRAEDGSLVVTGRLLASRVPLDPSHDPTWRLAVGIVSNSHGQTKRGQIIESSDLISIAATANHQDPAQPTITIKEAPMNLVRLGHYHTPNDGDGSCQTALVCGVDTKSDAEDAVEVYVNLHVWKKDGDVLGNREGVRAGAPDGYASFHLSGDCPFGR